MINRSSNGEEQTRLEATFKDTLAANVPKSARRASLVLESTSFQAKKQQ